VNSLWVSSWIGTSEPHYYLPNNQAERNPPGVITRLSESTIC